LYEVNDFVVHAGGWRAAFNVGGQLCAYSLNVGVVRCAIGAFGCFPEIDDRDPASVRVPGGDVHQFTVFGSLGGDDRIHHSVLELEELLRVSGDREDR